MNKNNNNAFNKAIKNLNDGIKNKIEFPKFEMPKFDTSILHSLHIETPELPQIKYENTIPGKLDELKSETIAELSRINEVLNLQLQETQEELRKTQIENQKVKREARIWNTVSIIIAICSLLVALK